MNNSANKPVRAELVERLSFSLKPHPHTPSLAVNCINAHIKIEPLWLTLRWKAEGSAQIIVPPLAGKGRADGLWQTTCFELFLREEDGSYTEFNLSPSEQWAAYDFTAYRGEGCTNRPMFRDPTCTIRRGGNTMIFDAAIPLAALPSLPKQLALSAVIEELDGTKSYWALAHPPLSHNGGKPDFHHPDCFVATLPAPANA